MNTTTVVRPCVGLLGVLFVLFCLAAMLPATVEGAAPAKRPTAANSAPAKNARKANVNRSAVKKAVKKHHKHKHHKHHKKHKTSGASSGGSGGGGLITQVKRDETRLNRDLNRLRRALR